MHSASFARRTEETGIETCVMCHKEFAVSAEFIEHAKSFFLRRSIRNHGIVDSGKLCDSFRNMFFRIYKGIEFFLEHTVYNTNRTDFGHSFGRCGKSGCFKVKYNYFVFKSNVRISENCFYGIVNKICFDAINDFEVRVFESSCGFSSFGESLNNTVVGNGNSAVSPIMGTFNKLFGRSYTVHLGHIGVAMEFETLFFLIICSVKSLNFTDISGADSYVMFIFIESSFSGNHNSITVFKGKNPLRFLFLCNYFKNVRAGKVGEHDCYDNAFAVPCFPAFNRENISPDNNSSALHINIAKFHRALFYRTSHYNFHIGNIYGKSGGIKSTVSERNSLGCCSFGSWCRTGRTAFCLRIGIRNRNGFAFAYFGNFGSTGKFNFNFHSEFFADNVFHYGIAAVFKKHFCAAMGKFNFENSVFKINFAVA